MNYFSGERICLNDEVKLGEDESGRVVAILDSDDYSEGFSPDIKNSLKEGIFVVFSNWGLIHYTQANLERDLVLLNRGGVLRKLRE